MRLSVIGCGHLGVVHAACMADIGHEVLGVDIDEVKTEMLNSGRPGSANRASTRCCRATSPRAGSVASRQRGAFMNYGRKARGACRTGKAR